MKAQIEEYWLQRVASVLIPMILPIIETYIADKEAVTMKQFLRVIDLPLGDRDLVIRELTLMGVTPGSLFPGIEGTCEELRERSFSH